MGYSVQLLLAVGVLAIACHRSDDAPEGQPPAPAPASPDSIPEGPLAGMLRGQEFTHQVATYVVDRRRGYEHFDIRLSARQTDDPCARGGDAGGASVWVRRWGADAVEAATVRLAPGGDSDWEVHYQLPEPEHWVGSGEASALLVLSPPGPDLTVRGELWACFADAHQSCVSGAFQARHCTISIDTPIRGTQLMERPPPRAPAGSSSAPHIAVGPAGSAAAPPASAARVAGEGGNP